MLCNCLLPTSLYNKIINYSTAVSRCLHFNYIEAQFQVAGSLFFHINAEVKTTRRKCNSSGIIFNPNFLEAHSSTAWYASHAWDTVIIVVTVMVLNHSKCATLNDFTRNRQMIWFCKNVAFGNAGNTDNSIFYYNCMSFIKQKLFGF